MTHGNIYTKFMIEYDKAEITSSYPSLTKKEIATILDKAYLALISQKLTGNNPRQAGFEADNKAIEDVRPLIVKSTLSYESTDSIPSNTVLFKTPEDYLFYIQSMLHMNNNMDMWVKLVSHVDAERFANTATNLPWISEPVCTLDAYGIQVYFDSVQFNKSDVKNLLLTYVKNPTKFDGDTDDTVFELSDSMAEELINLAIIMATKIVENPRTSVEIQTRPLES